MKRNEAVEKTISNYIKGGYSYVDLNISNLMYLCNSIQPINMFRKNLAYDLRVAGYTIEKEKSSREIIHINLKSQKFCLQIGKRYWNKLNGVVSIDFECNCSNTGVHYAFVDSDSFMYTKDGRCETGVDLHTLVSEVK